MEDMIVFLCIGCGALSLIMFVVIIYMGILSGRIKNLQDVVSNHERTLFQSDAIIQTKIITIINILALRLGYKIGQDSTGYIYCTEVFYNKLDKIPALSDRVVIVEAALNKTVQYLDMLYNHLGLELKPETIEPEKIIKKEEPAKTTTGNNRKEK